MDPTLSNGERILINLLKKPDYDDIVVVDGYTEYGRQMCIRDRSRGLPNQTYSIRTDAVCPR